MLNAYLLNLQIIYHYVHCKVHPSIPSSMFTCDILTHKYIHKMHTDTPVRITVNYRVHIHTKL